MISRKEDADISWRTSFPLDFDQYTLISSKNISIKSLLLTVSFCLLRVTTLVSQWQLRVDTRIRVLFVSGFFPIIETNSE